MSIIDKTYHHLLQTILDDGFRYEDPNRKGVNRIQIPHYTFEHNFSDGFPALTTKDVYFKGAVGELLTFLSGSTDIRDLWKRGVRFWDKDFMNYQNIGLDRLDHLYTYRDNNCYATKEEYSLGKIYPYQLRSWNGNIDQISNLIKD